MCDDATGFKLLKKKTASDETTYQFCTKHTRQELMRALSLGYSAPFLATLLAT
jgi:hypothetical protein